MDNVFFDAKESINEIEKTNNLHFLKINNIYIWGELRNFYFFKIINKNYHQERRVEKNNSLNIFKIFRNRFSTASPNDNLVILGHRKIAIKNDENSDPTTFELRNLLKSYNVLDDRPFNGRYQLKYKNNVYHNIDLLILRKIKKVKISENDQKKIIEINNIFKQHFPEIEFNISEVNSVVKRFLLDYNYYYKNLKKQKVKKIFLPSYYSHFALLLAAKELGILTTEIQYSSINKNHINYDFSCDEEIPYLPENMILWSRFYDKPFLKYNRKFFINKDLVNINKKKKKKIVVISQDLIAEEIHILAKELSKIKEISDYELVLKQHPWEKPIAYKEIKVIDSDSKQSISDIISDAEVVISSFSTVIDEALQLGCNVILFDNGFDKIVDIEYELKRIKKAEDIVSLLPFERDKHITPFMNSTEDSNSLLYFLNEGEK